MVDIGSPPPKWKRIIEALGTENKELAKDLASKKVYISKMEAKLATGGYVQRYARLEEKMVRLQKKYKELETTCAEQEEELSHRRQENGALQRALQQKVDDWNGRNHGETLQGSLLFEIGMYKERALLAEKQLANDVMEREQVTRALTEVTYNKETLQNAYDQAVLEVIQLQKHLDTVTDELHCMEETKLLMLQALEEKVKEAEQLEPMLQMQKKMEAFIETLVHDKAQMEERLHQLETKNRQLAVLKELQDEKLLQANAQIATLSSKLNEVESHTEALAHGHNDAITKIGFLQDHLKNLLQERDGLADQNRQIVEQLEAARLMGQQQSLATHQEAEKYQQLAQSLASHQAAAKQVEETLKATLQRTNAESSRLQDRLMEIMDRCQDAEKNAERYRLQAVQLENELTSLRGKDNTLQKTVVDKLQSLRAEVQTLKSENARLKLLAEQDGQSSAPQLQIQAEYGSSRYRSRSAPLIDLDTSKELEQQVAALSAENQVLKQKNEELLASKKEFMQRVKDKANVKLRDRVKLFEDRLQIRTSQLTELIAGLQEQNQVLTSRLAALESNAIVGDANAGTTKACHYDLMGQWLDNSSRPLQVAQFPSDDKFIQTNVPLTTHWTDDTHGVPTYSSHPVPCSPSAEHDYNPNPQPHRQKDLVTNTESLAAGGACTPSEQSSRTTPGHSPMSHLGQREGASSDRPPASNCGLFNKDDTSDLSVQSSQERICHQEVQPAAVNLRHPEQSLQPLLALSQHSPSTSAPARESPMWSCGTDEARNLPPTTPIQSVSPPLTTPSATGWSPIVAQLPQPQSSDRGVFFSSPRMVSRDILTLMELAEADSALLGTP